MLSFSQNIFNSKIGVIGLGYVGLPLAVAFAKKYSVTGYDISRERIESLKRGFDNTFQHTKSQLVKNPNLKFTSDFNEISRCNVYIVTVPTPVDDVNRPKLDNIINACLTVSSFLKKNDLVIFESTVYPGLTEEVCIPLIESQSGLSCNIDFGCGYSPERINPGDNNHTFTTIIKVTSGSNKKVAIRVDQLYSSVVEAGTFMAKNIKTAEAAKVIENAQRDINIAFMNELSIIFNKMDINTYEVLKAASTKWNFLSFTPGFVGGHCIGVDPYYLTHKAEQLGHHPQVILAGRKINDDMPIYAASLLVKKMLEKGINLCNARVGILGITFKENCSDIRNSKTINFIYELKKYSLKVMAADYWVNPEFINNHEIELLNIEDLRELDALVISVPHNKYKKIKINSLLKMYRSTNKNKILFDLKSAFPLSLTSKYFEVISL